MISEDSINYFRFAGARILLSRFKNGIPPDVASWQSTMEPAVRALWDSSERGGRTLYEVAAEVRELAHLVMGVDTAAAAPADLAEILLRGGHENPAEQLSGIADHLEGWNSRFALKLEVAVPTSWELGYRFPQLNSFLSTYFGQDGIAVDEDLSEADGIDLYIRHCHPICLWMLPRLVSECAEALAIFHDEAALVRFFEVEHGLGAGNLPWSDFLPLLSNSSVTHLRSHHPPHWITS